MKDTEIEDPLKPIDEILLPDERQQHFIGTLEDNHAELSGAILLESVPLDVRQLFETAKNLSLYSWFVYRFHQVAEQVAFSSLEMALRLRYKQENPSSKKRMMLSKLLKHAVEQKWVSNDDFPNLREIAHHRAEQKKLFSQLQEQKIGQGVPLPIEPPTDAEIESEFQAIDMISHLPKLVSSMRNNLAHGSSTLHPNSISTLRQTAHIINAIYK